jgi:hypothetical protein
LGRSALVAVTIPAGVVGALARVLRLRMGIGRPCERPHRSSPDLERRSRRDVAVVCGTRRLFASVPRQQLDLRWFAGGLRVDAAGGVQASAGEARRVRRPRSRRYSSTQSRELRHVPAAPLDAQAPACGRDARRAIALDASPATSGTMNL